MSGIQKLFLPRSEEDDVAESAFSSSKGRKKREEEGGIDWNKFAKRKGKGGWSIDECPTGENRRGDEMEIYTRYRWIENSWRKKVTTELSRCTIYILSRLTSGEMIDDAR